MKLKSRIINLIPPLLWPLVRWVFKSRLVYWQGNYPDWASAKRDTVGYDSSGILQKVLASALLVKQGKALYERDSVLFYTEEKDNPILPLLKNISAQHQGKLHVLDFGGSLGSTYFQHREWLSTLPEVSWHILEQASFVEAGKAHLQDETLKFHASLEEIPNLQSIHVILLSSVIQYLEHGVASVDHLLKLGIPDIIVERTNFTDTAPTKLTKQTVPPAIYTASYPCWIFNRESFQQEFLSRNYTVAKTWKGATLNQGYLGGILFHTNPN